MNLDFDFETKSVDDTGTIKGIASTFGGPPDDGGDVIMPGAFQRTLSNKGRNGNGILMLRNHDRDSIPGVWTKIEENERGLKVQGILALDTQLGHDVHALLKIGGFKGLSIGFDLPRDKATQRPRKDTFEIADGVRYIKETILWEISLVSFPMNRRAKITSIKEAIGFDESQLRSIDNIKTPREMESFLREAGLSVNEAKYIVKLCKENLREVSDPSLTTTELDRILTLLKKENLLVTAVNSLRHCLIKKGE